MRNSTVAVLFAAVALAGDPQKIEGVWKGESLCTGVLPACKDEKVIYTFRAPAADGTVWASADKVVDGQRVNMGTSTYQYDQAHGILTWQRWKLTIQGSSIEGTLTLASGEVARKMKLAKE